MERVTTLASESPVVPLYVRGAFGFEAPQTRASLGHTNGAIFLLALCTGCSPSADSGHGSAVGVSGGNPATLSRLLGSSGSSALDGEGGEAGQVDTNTSAAGFSTALNICNAAINPDSTLVEGCVLANACDPLVPQFSLSMCITYDTLAGCVVDAEDCNEVAQCNRRQWELESACSSDDVGWKCSGSRAIQCGDERPWSVDCGALGGTCLLYTGSESDTTWPCWTDTPAHCELQPGRFGCSGAVRYSCHDGLAYGVDCSRVGLSCIEDVTGYAYCGTVPSTCDEPSTSSCVLNTAEVCSASGHAFKYDCSRGGGSCRTDGGQEWYCPAPGCAPEDELGCAEECVDASVMKVCVGGAPYHIDCNDYGFSQCVLYGDPTDDGTYVGCQ